MAASSPTAIGANRRGAVGQWLALLGVAIAVAAVVALIVTWPGHGDGESSGAAPPAAKQALEPAAAVSPAARNDRRR